MSEIKIEIKDLFKIFGSNPVDMVPLVKEGISKEELLQKHQHVLGLKNIDIEIKESDIQVIMGLSGSGKSTLIRHLIRLIEPTSGEIIVNNANIMEMTKQELLNFRRSSVSMVFQNFGLFPHRTVTENAAYGLTIQGIEATEATTRSQKWVDRVGLTGFENYYPAQLSGGMQQRVGLARALATNAQILLMDEPFSALDPLIREEMQDVLLGLQEELRKTIVFITHDLDEALKLGDHIAILRDGAVIQKGPPQDILLNPVDSYITNFTKNINRGRVIRVGYIMEVGPPGSSLNIDQNVVIDDALQVLSNAGAQSATVTNNSKPVGSIDLGAIVKAMARPGD